MIHNLVFSSKSAYKGEYANIPIVFDKYDAPLVDSKNVGKMHFISYRNILTYMYSDIYIIDFTYQSYI